MPSINPLIVVVNKPVLAVPPLTIARPVHAPKVAVPLSERSYTNMVVVVPLLADRVPVRVIVYALVLVAALLVTVKAALAAKPTDKNAAIVVKNLFMWTFL